MWSVGMACRRHPTRESGTHAPVPPRISASLRRPSLTAVLGMPAAAEVGTKSGVGGILAQDWRTIAAARTRNHLHCVRFNSEEVRGWTCV
jgi:hypothetical protein